MGNELNLAEILEPTDKTEIDEETGTVVVAKTDDDTPPVKEDETPPKVDETPPKDDTTPPVKDDDTPVKDDGLLSLEEQNRELRQILRSQKKDITIMESKLSRLEKKSAAPVPVTKTDEDDIANLFGEKTEKVAEPVVEEKLTALEVAQNELTALASSRQQGLDTLLEVMKMNPKFEDVEEVCSQTNFSDIFAAVGEAVSEKEGKDITLAMLEAELSVWKMPNPYKYMYNIIKEHHPKYAVKKDEAGKPVPDKALPDKVPTSLANVPGKETGTDAWTAARIDSMPEDQLHTVPADIYEKYLSGGLD